MSEFIDLVRASLGPDAREEFDARVDRQAAYLIDEIESGRLDNTGFAIGLELESYGVDATGHLATLPDAVFEVCNKELGLHNLELNSDPSPFDADGLDQQATAISDVVHDARTAFHEVDLELVLDAMWTIPPPTGTLAYLREIDRVDGFVVASNMRRSARYCALDNDVLDRHGGSIELDLPGCRESFPTILPEALTTSIQPHLQIPSTARFPRYYNTAIRTMAPILALAANSPLLPTDLYSAVDDPYELLEETYHELRIPVFEQSINAGDDKVRFPDDIESASEVVSKIADDAVRAPFLREWIEDDDPDGFRDGFWELDHKRGMYWRWLRGIPGGQPVGDGSERSLRIEYRPLPTQPSVSDNIGLQWLTVGVIRGLVAADHPLATLEWTTARSGFYDVVEEGLDAAIPWVDRSGTRTDDKEVVFSELFEFARQGLRAAGVATERIDSYLDPIEARWQARCSPSRWKLDAVESSLDVGASLEAAITEMQMVYNERSTADVPFADWL